MKSATVLTAGIAIVLGFAAPRQVEARVDVSFEVFYESLEPYGAWFEVADYGYCWQPTTVDADWRPYTIGQWVYTDAGWTWVSDEPWGWATYHYGRWILLEDEGWVWWPDVEWAPAWVSWRYSESHVGWAPLPPEARWNLSVGFGPWVDVYYDIGPACYSFVESRHFCSPRLRERIMPRRQNVTFIQSTVNITNISHRETTIFNEGPRYEVMAELSDTPVRRLKLDRHSDVEFDAKASRTFRDSLKGDRLEVIAPVIRRQSADIKPDKVVKKVDRALVDRGWARMGDSKAVQEAHEKVKRESAAVIPPGLPPGSPVGRSGKTKADVSEPGGQRIPKALPGPDMPPTPRALPVPETPPGKRREDERTIPPRTPEELPPRLKPKARDEERPAPPQPPQNLKPLPKPRHQNEEVLVPRTPTPDPAPRFKPKPKADDHLIPKEAPPRLKPLPKPQPRQDEDFLPPQHKPRPTLPPSPKTKEHPVLTPSPSPSQIVPPSKPTPAPPPKGKAKDDDRGDKKK